MRGRVVSRVTHVRVLGPGMRRSTTNLPPLPHLPPIDSRSIGIDDVTPSDSLTCTKNTTVEENYAKCDGLILKFNQGKLELNPGCSPEETLEVRKP